MAYKMICFDMDGTLLDSWKRISANNIAMLRKAHAQGVRIAISTGRIYVDAGRSALRLRLSLRMAGYLHYLKADGD